MTTKDVGSRVSVALHSSYEIRRLMIIIICFVSICQTLSDSIGFSGLVGSLNESRITIDQFPDSIHEVLPNNILMITLPNISSKIRYLFQILIFI